MQIYIKIIMFIFFINYTPLKAQVNYNELNQLNSSIDSNLVDLYLLLIVSDMHSISFENMSDLLIDIHNNKTTNPQLQIYNISDTLTLLRTIINELENNKDINNNEINKKCELYTKHCDVLHTLIDIKLLENEKMLLQYYKNLSITKEDILMLITNTINLKNN